MFFRETLKSTCLGLGIHEFSIPFAIMLFILPGNFNKIVRTVCVPLREKMVGLHGDISQDRIHKVGIMVMSLVRTADFCRNYCYFEVTKVVEDFLVTISAFLVCLLLLIQLSPYLH